MYGRKTTIDSQTLIQHGSQVTVGTGSQVMVMGTTVVGQDWQGVPQHLL